MKVTKKGSCKCHLYREEIEELRQTIRQLREEKIPSFITAINENTNFTKHTISSPQIPNSFSEFDAQMNEMNEGTEGTEVFPTLEELQQEIIDINTDIDKEHFKDINEDFVHTRKTYNPNILPVKEITGYEPFDNDAFNREFERTRNVNFSLFGEL